MDRTLTVAGGATSQDEVRRHNLSRLLRLLHLHGAASRADLTALTGLNRSTVRALCADLAGAGLVEQSPPVATGGAGRPSITVAPRSEHVFVLALDIGVEHLTGLRVGLGGAVSQRCELGQQSGDYDIRRCLRRVAGLTRTLLAGAPPDAVCVGIGVGVCGVVDPHDGAVRFAPNLGWVDVPLRRLLVRTLKTRLPIEVGNDGDLGARAEVLRGAAQGLRDLVYISGEVGIGGGIVLDGRPLRGAGGFAGEIGHMSVNPDGHICRCGRRGCWETEVGDAAVLKATGAAPGMTLPGVLAAYAAGEDWAREGIARVVRYLALGTVNLVNIFNPQAVLFGGATSQLFAATEPLLRAALADALTAPREQVRLALPQLTPDSTALGAAELAFEPLLADPLSVTGFAVRQVGA